MLNYYYIRGPLSQDGSGRVDWELLNSILIVISLNVHDHIAYTHDYCPHVIHPSGISSTLPYSAPGLKEHTKTDDWAGITGDWRRLIAFCDFRDLRLFNVSVRAILIIGRCHLPVPETGY